MRHLRLLIFMLLALTLLPLQASASDFGERVSGMAEVTGVRISSQSDKVRIVVEATKDMAFKKIILSNPDRVVVDLPNAWLSPKARKDIDLGSPFAGRLKVAQFDKQTVRIVVETKVGMNNYNVFKLTGGAAACRIVLDFGDISESSDNRKIDLPEDRTTQPEPAYTPPASETDEVEKEMASPDKSERTEEPQDTGKKEAEKKKPIKVEETPSGGIFEGSDKDSGDELDKITGLKGRKIAIDAGHGGSDSGAIGPTGVMEKTITLKVATELKNLLVAEGATVYMTRTKDTEVSPKKGRATDIEELQARCDIANAKDADIFISIHMDSFTNAAAKGTTGYYYARGSKKSRELADKIRQGVIDQIGTQSRGTQSCNFYVVKHTDMPATLVELAFISNRAEEKLLYSDAGAKKAAQGILDGIEDYFN